jgi:hypothetical protein
MKRIFANYDWDDNILRMPTKIIYFNQNKNSQLKEIPVSTELFAHTRLKVGKEDHFINYKESENGELEECSKEEATLTVNIKNFMIDSTNDASFRQFRDCQVNDYFLNDLKKAIKNNAFAPSWNDFVEHCSCPEAAEQVTIITARGQSPDGIYNGMVYMQSQGLIKFVPKKENIFPVSFKGLPKEFVGQADNPSDQKKNVLASILDRVEKSTKTCSRFHTVGFSDDDKKTFDVMASFLQEQVDKGRWKGFELNLYFTGKGKKERHILLKTEKVA